MQKHGRILFIAGSDSGGGAGIQADIKTATAMGAHASTAITVITAQNTLGVQRVTAVEPTIVKEQIRSVLSDIGADAVKTGMLYSGAIIEAVIDTLDEMRFNGPIVVDPVMVATSGDPLLMASASERLKHLIARAHIITPNIPEAEYLLGRKIGSINAMEDAARALLDLGPEYVILKGGHLDGADLTDILVSKTATHRLVGTRVMTQNTHGTGCTFASAVAALLSRGMTVIDAFERAHDFVRCAIEAAPGFGAGHGPLGHASVCKAFRESEPA